MPLADALQIGRFRFNSSCGDPRAARLPGQRLVSRGGCRPAGAKPANSAAPSGSSSTSHSQLIRQQDRSARLDYLAWRLPCLDRDEGGKRCSPAVSPPRALFLLRVTYIKVASPAVANWWSSSRDDGCSSARSRGRRDRATIISEVAWAEHTRAMSSVDYATIAAGYRCHTHNRFPSVARIA